MKKAAPNLRKLISTVYSLSLTLSADDETLAFPVPSEVINASTDGTVSELQDVLLGVGRVPHADISSDVARSDVEARGGEARDRSCLSVL